MLVNVLLVQSCLQIISDSNLNRNVLLATCAHSVYYIYWLCAEKRLCFVGEDALVRPTFHH